MRNVLNRRFLIPAIVASGVLAQASSAFATGLTIEYKTFTEPIIEVFGIAGTALGGIVIGGLVAMGTVALFKAGWSLGKRLIAKIA
jgi:hypothetical protein